VDEVEAIRSGFEPNDADYLLNPQEWSLSEFSLPFDTLVEDLKTYDHYSEAEKLDLLNHWANFPVLHPFDLFDIRNWFVEKDSVTVIDDCYYGRPIGGRKLVRIGAAGYKYPWHRIRNRDISKALCGDDWEFEEDNEPEPPKKEIRFNPNKVVIEVDLTNCSDSDDSIIISN
jgi:hypothetical protein